MMRDSEQYPFIPSLVESADDLVFGYRLKWRE